jgi:hypothetical protein
MYLFSRRTRLSDGNGTAGVEWAGKIAAKVKELTGTEIQLWATVYSPGFGTISWTGWFEDLQALEAVGDKLQADPAMEKLVNAGAKYTQGGLDDGLVQPIYGTPTDAPIQYVGGAVAVCAAGSFERAMAAGVEIAQKAEAVTGLPTLFGRSVTGPYGGVGWLTGYESAAAMEKADAALAADSGWLKLLDSTKGCFAEDASITQSTIFRRIG